MERDSLVHLVFGGKLKSVSSIHFIKMMKPVETCYSVVLLIWKVIKINDNLIKDTILFVIRVIWLFYLTNMISFKMFRMFRVFGHKKVWVLDGGLPQWRASGFNVENASPDDAVLKSNAANKAVERFYNGEQVS